MPPSTHPVDAALSDERDAEAAPCRLLVAPAALQQRLTGLRFAAEVAHGGVGRGRAIEVPELPPHPRAKLTAHRPIHRPKDRSFIVPG